MINVLTRPLVGSGGPDEKFALRVWEGLGMRIAPGEPHDTIVVGRLRGTCRWSTERKLLLWHLFGRRGLRLRDAAQPLREKSLRIVFDPLVKKYGDFATEVGGAVKSGYLIAF